MLAPLPELFSTELFWLNSKGWAAAGQEFIVPVPALASK